MPRTRRQQFDGRVYSHLLLMLATTLALLGIAPALAQTIAFAARTDIGVGAQPYAVTIVDFNRDGKLDFAVANRAMNNVAIRLGNGDGTFQPNASYPVGSNPEAMTTGDFNADGLLDLAAANWGSNTLSVGLGSGDGSLQPAAHYGVGGSPRAIAAADFNADGTLDLLTSNWGSTSVALLSGNGDGTFQTARHYGVGLAPWGVAVGDFNGDSKLDVAVAARDSGAVSVRLGNGDGTFQPNANYIIGGGGGGGPIAVASGDFNADSRLDLAIGNNALNKAQILLGNGDGTFQPPVNYTVGSLPNSLTVGDLDGDGRLDLAVANYNSNHVSILLGTGDGTLQPAVHVGAGSQPTSVGMGDFNSDGKLDLAVSNKADWNVSILLAENDTTPPQITCDAPDGTWHNDNVSLACTASDGNSGLANTADASFRLSTNIGVGSEDANTFTDSRSVCDVAGNCATAGPISGNKVDKQAPSITIGSPTKAAYLLNEVVTATYTCADGGSGVASCTGPVTSGSAIDTASVGSKTFAVSVVDTVGNSTQQSMSYTVLYSFDGFFQPVDPMPTLNVVKAGSAIPVKFSLGGHQGLNIFAANYPASQLAACDSSDPVDPIEATVTAGTSSLSYDPGTGQYIYVWKTDKTWAGTCRMLIVKLNDGTEHRANFKFSK